MGRLIFIAVIVFAVVWLLKRAVAGPPSERGEGDAGNAGAPQGELVTCAHCALNLPRAEARDAGGRFYCSDEHRRLGPRDR